MWPLKGRKAEGRRTFSPKKMNRIYIIYIKWVEARG